MWDYYMRIAQKTKRYTIRKYRYLEMVSFTFHCSNEESNVIDSFCSTINVELAVNKWYDLTILDMLLFF